MPQVNISVILQAIIALFGAFFLAFWISLIIWTVRDVRSRSRDIFAQLLATLMVLVFNVFGLLLYFVLRPPETLAEAYERALEEEALLKDIEERLVCPGCKQKVQPDFTICPACHTQLRKACPACDRLLHLKWNICPYCGAIPGAPKVSVEKREMGYVPEQAREFAAQRAQPYAPAQPPKYMPEARQEYVSEHSERYVPEEEEYVLEPPQDTPVQHMDIEEYAPEEETEEYALEPPQDTLIQQVDTEEYASNSSQDTLTQQADTDKHALGSSEDTLVQRVDTS